MFSSFEYGQAPLPQVQNNHPQALDYDLLGDDLETMLLQFYDNPSLPAQQPLLDPFHCGGKGDIYEELESENSPASHDGSSCDFDYGSELTDVNSISPGNEAKISSCVDFRFAGQFTPQGFSSIALESTSEAPIKNKPESNERKYSCSICMKRFKRPSSLNTHMNIHTGQKPFPCPAKNCGKSFNAKSNMLRHFKLHYKLSPGVYLLPSGEITTQKPSSRELLLYYSAMEQQNQGNI